MYRNCSDEAGTKLKAPSILKTSGMLQGCTVLVEKCHGMWLAKTSPNISRKFFSAMNRNSELKWDQVQGEVARKARNTENPSL